MQREPFTPLSHIPWIRWIDRTELPAIAIGLGVWLLFIPLYNFNALMPQLPLEAAGFPPALALSLMFLIQLTRGANKDLQQLIWAGKIGPETLETISAGRGAALVELAVGVAIGLERVYSQISYIRAQGVELEQMVSFGAFAVCLSIVFYTVIQIHLLGFCVRQVVGFKRIASSFEVDLLAPELNNALSNPLIRFLMVGLVALSFGLLVYEFIPFASLQRRLLQGSLIAGLIWVVLIVFSMIPLMILKSRIAVAKSMEINVIRRVLAGDASDVAHSQFGERLSQFSPADLMYYEDRIKNVWEWPVEAHIRRLIIFGLLPPLTWVLAAAVEVVFDSMLAG